MTDDESVLLLCFRATGHYWPLAFRQLALPVGCPGESFPYRPQFVFNKPEPGTFRRALICMKYDAADRQFGASTYIPLRWATQCSLSSTRHEDLLTFGFNVGPTVAYTAVESTQHRTDQIATMHSPTIQQAVRNALTAAGRGQIPDDDHALVILLDAADVASLNVDAQEREDERWINITRLLSSQLIPGGQYFQHSVTFTRLNHVRYMDLEDPPQPFDRERRRFSLFVNRDVELDVLSVSYPRASVPTGDEAPTALVLNANPDEVITVIGRSKLSPGIWLHRFELTPRKITDYTVLSVRAEGVGARHFATDFAVPASIAPLHMMEVIDASDPSAVQCAFYGATDPASQPRRGQYLVASVDKAATRKVVLIVEGIETADADSRRYVLRMIGVVDGQTAKHWDGATLDGESAPTAFRIDLSVDVSDCLKTLCGHSNDGQRCSLVQVTDSGPAFDLRVPKGFQGVHTAVFGQTGSGKSYSVGVMLEELFANGFKLLVLDPNSDFIHFVDRHKDLNSAPEFSAYRTRGDAFFEQDVSGRVRVFTNRTAGERADWKRCALSFRDLSVRQQAGLIHVDRDRVDLYSEHKKLSEQLSNAPYGPKEFRQELDRSAELSAESARRKLAALYSNYELEAMNIWDIGTGSVISALEEFYKAPGGQMMVVDLGSLPNVEARLLVAGNILEKIWDLGQHSAKPERVTIVVDEAHNLVTPDPELELRVVTTEILNRIAAEGRKYGLCLLLMTQRPSKLHPNSLGMVSNLVCMRVTNQDDLGVVRTVFGNVPRSLLERVPFLSQGQALVSGKLVPFPMILRFGRRFTDEGIKEPK
jgi:uncharacterized protein DUF87